MICGACGTGWDGNRGRFCGCELAGVSIGFDGFSGAGGAGAAFHRVIGMMYSFGGMVCCCCG